MKLHIISEDIELINSFKEISNLQTRVIDKDNINDSGAEILVISNKLINIRELITIKLSNAKCFYLSDEGDIEELSKIDSGLLFLKKIIIIPPKRTIIQIQEYILNDIYEVSKENNVYTFFGSDSKVGVTSIAQLVAENIAKRHKNKSVLMLFLDGQTGFDWIDNRHTKTCLADIKAAIKNNLLTFLNLKENCYQYMQNLYLLKGEIAIKDNVYYHQSEINTLINLCKDNFDFVIIDAGNTMNLQLRMTYSALINSDNRFLVADQLPKTFEMYKKGKYQILDDLNIGSFKFLILNKYMKNSIIPKKEDISDKYELPIMSTLPYLDYHFQACTDKSPSIFETDIEYKDNLKKIVEYIEKKRGVFVSENKKRGIFSWLKTDKKKR